MYSQILLKKKKIYCKNIFLLFLVFEYFLNKVTNASEKIPTKVAVFCIKLNRTSLGLLRAPNRSKTAQISLKREQYLLLLTIRRQAHGAEYLATRQEHTIQNPTTVVKINKMVFSRFKFFESNILQLQSVKLMFPYNFTLVF